MKINATLIKTILSFILAVLLTLGYFFIPKQFFSLDNKLRDFMFLMREDLPKTDKIVIVDIDEKSLKAYGQWPWSRDIITLLLTKIRDKGAGIIGLDIVFAEEDRSSPHKLVQKFPEIKQKLPNYDFLLAKCFQTSPIIGGYVFNFREEKAQEAPIIPAVVIRRNMKDNDTLFKPNSVILNIPILQDSLYSSGFFNNIPDPNGMIRSVPLIMEYDHSIYTSLALEMVRIYTNTNKLEVIGDEYGITNLAFGKFDIPVDEAGRLFVNFRGKAHHYNYISPVDIIEGKVQKEEIEGKFVLIGTSALGLFDLRAIPLDSTIPGVEIHANVIDNILQNDILHTPYNHQLVNIALIWFFIIFTMIFLSFFRSLYIILGGFFLLISTYYIFFILLFKYYLVLNLLFPLLAIAISFLLTMATDYVIEHKKVQEAKKILGKKVSPRVMDYLIKHSEEQLVASREVQASIFFSDIVGFTTISEKVGSPDKLISMLNTYMTPMVESIIKQEGTIDKFIGDAVMAYWNAPIEVPQHADKALTSAIEQIEMLHQINQIVTPKYGVVLDIGIGIHTGLVTAGDMGAEGRSDYTILGDNVNLASRLEGLTRVYDVQILISKDTYDALEKTHYRTRTLDLVEVKGKSVAIEIFEVICNTKNISEKELSLHHLAIKQFRNAKVQNALVLFKELEILHSSKIYQNYILRCQDFLDNPSKLFTPILKMLTK